MPNGETKEEMQQRIVAEIKKNDKRTFVRRTGNPKLLFKFVVNGETVEIKSSVHWRLDWLRGLALKQTNNTGRPNDDWELRDEFGNLLDLTQTADKLINKTFLFLTLKVGAGG